MFTPPSRDCARRGFLERPAPPICLRTQRHFGQNGSRATSLTEDRDGREGESAAAHDSTEAGTYCFSGNNPARRVPRDQREGKVVICRVLGEDASAIWGGWPAQPGVKKLQAAGDISPRQRSSGWCRHWPRRPRAAPRATLPAVTDHRTDGGGDERDHPPPRGRDRHRRRRASSRRWCVKNDASCASCLDWKNVIERRRSKLRRMAGARPV